MKVSKNALVLAAGLGTRLKPWTLEHPKALVPVRGIPVLAHVIKKLEKEGFDKIAVNVHHFADQIEDYLNGRAVEGVEVSYPLSHDVDVFISDERGNLLDTGGALLKAYALIGERCAQNDLATSGHILVHNVDILSDAPLGELYNESLNNDGLTLLVSDRDSGRKLIFDKDKHLTGWHNLRTGELRRPGGYSKSEERELAFSGIYVAGARAIQEMEELYGMNKPFSIIDYMIDSRRNSKVIGYEVPKLNLIDIGKPETLAKANVLAE